VNDVVEGEREESANFERLTESLMVTSGWIVERSKAMELGLANKTALVTGGSKGIGLETARALAREGVKVLICARRESALADAARDIMQTTQGKIETYPLDVTKVEQIETIPRVVKDKLGHIDILINNAGTGTYKPFLEVTDEELVDGMAINFFAQFRICQRIVPMMIARGGGRIINVSGQTGIMTLNPPFLSSCTGPAKSAEIRFSKVLANELAPHNIRVNCVIPGFINTPERFAKWEREVAKRQLSPEDAARERSLWSSNQGMRDTRWGTPEEIANLVVFAVSDAASYINGAALVADNAMDKS
jgi:3-oxoacyl-[acyl-carrier protein] reductase